MTLTRPGYKPRLSDDKIRMYLKARGAVCVEGPKWCGKTWSCLNVANSALLIGDSSNNFGNKALAEVDVTRALQGEEPRLIDEWQEVPLLWDAVRSEVDARGKKGCFILTGSSTPYQKGIHHSGIGRISSLRMHTMSLFESGDSSGDISLKDLFEGIANSAEISNPTLEHLIYLTIRGGWPNELESDVDVAMVSSRLYLEDFLETDLPKIDSSKNKEMMGSIIRSLARNESTLANNRGILKDIIAEGDEPPSESTLANYMNVLDRAFLLSPQQAFDPNYRSSKRIAKHPKRHFVDPSLPIAALELTPEKLINDLNTFGFFFEALCERDLRIYAETLGGKLYHYRDHDGGEIDAIVELSDGRWGAFEIKVGMYHVEDAAKNLLKMRDKFKSSANRGGPEFLCVIVGLSKYAYQRNDGVWVVPITALRN